MYILDRGEHHPHQQRQAQPQPYHHQEGTNW
jgi:hypothetical protein